MKAAFSNFERYQSGVSDADLCRQFNLPHIHRMHANESILGPSPKVVGAIQTAAGDIGNYPSMGDETLREALAAHYGRGLTPDHFYTGCSGYETIELITRTFLQPNDEVIASFPTFSIYKKLVALEGATLVDVPLLLPDFRLDIAGILAAITPRTRLLLLCNPNNPTGNLPLTATEMDTLVAQLPPDVLVVIDAVYTQFVTSPDYPDHLKYVLNNDSVVVIQTFSKAFGMAGLRLGYALASVEIAGKIAGIHRGFHQNRLALVAGVAALQDLDHMRENVRLALAGKAWLVEQLDQLGLGFYPSETNFMVIKMPLDPAEVAQKLLAFGVRVRPLAGWGLAGCLRVSVGSAAANQQFIAGLVQILGL